MRIREAVITLFQTQFLVIAVESDLKFKFGFLGAKKPYDILAHRKMRLVGSAKDVARMYVLVSTW